MIRTKRVMGGHGTAKDLRTPNFIKFGNGKKDYCVEFTVRDCK